MCPGQGARVSQQRLKGSYVDPIGAPCCQVHLHSQLIQLSNLDPSGALLSPVCRRNSPTLGPPTLTPSLPFYFWQAQPPPQAWAFLLSLLPLSISPSPLSPFLCSSPLHGYILECLSSTEQRGNVQKFPRRGGGTWHFVLTRNFLYFRVCNLTAICLPSTPLGDVLTTNLRALLLPSLHISEVHQRLSCGDRIIHIAWHRRQPGPLGWAEGAATDLRALSSTVSRILETDMVIWSHRYSGPQF